MAIRPRAAWALDRQVALRPEPFGALAYHFGTRRLSFLKSRTLLAVVQALGEQPTRACGVPRRRRRRARAARVLPRAGDARRSGMIVEDAA